MNTRPTRHSCSPLSERIEFEEVAPLGAGSAGPPGDALAGALRERGFEVFIADLTTPDLRDVGVTVVRAIIPGFQPLFGAPHEQALGGTRLDDVPARLRLKPALPERASPQTGLPSVPLEGHRFVSLPARPSPVPSVDASWEVFHENSKNSAFDLPFGQNARDSRTRRAAPPFATELYPAVALPETAVPVEIGLTTLLAQKSEAAHLAPASLPLPTLATLLYCAYGVTGHRDSVPGGLTRTVTSAGGVYPLEVLFHSRSVEGLEPGLYHYSPLRHRLHRLVDGDQTAAIASALVNRSLAVEATMFVFIVAAFAAADRWFRASAATATR